MTINYSKTFMKLFDKSPQHIRKAIVERIKCFEANPYDPILNNHALKGEFLGRRSINITGDWRAIYENKPNDEAFFILFGTHSELYG